MDAADTLAELRLDDHGPDRPISAPVGRSLCACQAIDGRPWGRAAPGDRRLQGLSEARTLPLAAKDRRVRR